MNSHWPSWAFYSYKSIRKHNIADRIISDRNVYNLLQSSKEDKTGFIYWPFYKQSAPGYCVKCPCWKGNVQRCATDSYFTLGTFLFTLESVFPAFLVSLLWAFVPFFTPAGLGAFSSCFFLGGFYNTEKKRLKKTPNCQLKYFKYLKCLNLVAASSTDLQFRLFARCFYGNQLWDFFLFFLLLRLLFLSLHLLLLLCGGVCLLYVLCLVLFGCSSLKFTKHISWLFYRYNKSGSNKRQTFLKLFSPPSWESEHASLRPPGRWGGSGLRCRWAEPLRFDSLSG